MPPKPNPASLLAARRWATTGTTEAHSAASRKNGKLGGRPPGCACGTCANCKRRAKAASAR